MSPTSRARRAGRSLVLAALGLALVAGCGDSPGSSPPPIGAPPTPHSSGLPAGCSQTVANPDQAGTALGRAIPGDTVCFTGNRLTDLALRMDVSGAVGKPISLIADGAVVRSIDVIADHVTVGGFAVADGDGLNLEGTGLVVRNNVVRNAADDGIDCTDCRDTLMESNTVWRADGTGIAIEGDRIEVRNNTVSESVMLEEGDADGIRFFGTSLRLTENVIRDIKATGYPEELAPHTDCFQTYESERRPTYDVLIANNVCENVDVQCLIATSDDGPPADIPNGSTAITFENNICTVNGSQGVLLENFPNVVVRSNTFTGPLYRAIFLARGSVNCTVVGNTVIGEIPAFEIDDESRYGFRAEGNTSR